MRYFTSYLKKVILRNSRYPNIAYDWFCAPGSHFRKIYESFHYRTPILFHFLKKPFIESFVCFMHSGVNNSLLVMPAMAPP